MATRIIDISVALQSDIASDPPGNEPKIAYIGHKQSAPEVCRFFPGLTPADLPDGEGWAVEAQLIVQDRTGQVLDDRVVVHLYTFEDGLIRSMSIER